MDKITFRNGEAPYINDINLNLMQTNIENAINYNIVFGNDPIKTGRKIDGKDEYVINFGVISINGTDGQLIDITDIDINDINIVRYEASIESTNYKISLPDFAVSLRFSKSNKIYVHNSNIAGNCKLLLYFTYTD